MANCKRCGRELPFYSLREICAPCRASVARFAAEQSIYHDPLPRLGDADAQLFVTIGLLALNGIAFLAMIFSGASPINPGTDELRRFGGSWGYSVFSQPWRLLTATYLHGGIIHLGFNMWCLWNLGGLAERIFDRWVYFLMYTSCGLAGSLAAAWLSPHSITVGASGAVFGIAGALISALYLGKLPLSRHAVQGTLRSLVPFIGYNLLFGFIVPNISNAAHIGGLLTGLTLGAVLSPNLTSTSPKRQIWALAVFLVAGVVLWGGFLFVRYSLLRGVG
jgi:rhomboid protease GluP